MAPGWTPAAGSCGFHLLFGNTETEETQPLSGRLDPKRMVIHLEVGRFPGSPGRITKGSPKPGVFRVSLDHW